MVVTPEDMPVARPVLLIVAIVVALEAQVQLVDHIAAVSNDGTVVKQPTAPEVVYLCGADEVRHLPSHFKSSADDFRATLAQIEPGSLIYRLFGKPTLDAKQVYIGSITIESNFVASEFGDRILAFRHAWGSK
jgi:hypothetical protein